MSEDIRTMVQALAQRVSVLEDQLAVSQLVARYGPAVDSGSGEGAAALWEDDGVFDVRPHGVWTGQEEIAGMVHGDGHQGLIASGCGHVLTAPHVVVDGDDARAWNHALNIRWDAEAGRFWVARVSANEWHVRRGPDGWRIASRLSQTLDGAASARELMGHSVKSAR